MSDDEPGPELERLRAENRALNDQVMLLVKTEQRLYRAQNEQDAQLVGIRALGRFALESSRSDTPAEIMTRALDLLAQGFTFDWAGVVVLEPQGRIARVLHEVDGRRGPGLALQVDPEVFEWLADRRHPELVQAVRLPAHAPAMRFVRTILPAALRPRDEDPCEMACAPFRGTHGLRSGLLLAYSARRRIAGPLQGHLAEQHLPFLELLALHTEHAVANSRLTESLRERSGELAASLESLEKAQAALVQSQKMEAIGRLAGGVAHDFNNLLTVILGYASTLTLSLAKDSANHENARRIVDAARRASGITSQLMALGRRQVASTEDVDLAEQAERLVDLLQRLVGEQIEVELHLDRTMGHIRADHSQVEQVLLNLVVNARDAMEQGGNMRIVTRCARPADAARCETPIDPADYGVLEVQDNGVGMDDGTLAQVFEPFFTTKPASHGTGLGLAVVYGIVRQGSGHVLVASEPGKGSTFTVLWPFASGGVTPAPGHAAGTPGSVAPAVQQG